MVVPVSDERHDPITTEVVGLSPRVTINGEKVGRIEEERGFTGHAIRGEKRTRGAECKRGSIFVG